MRSSSIRSRSAQSPRRTHTREDEHSILIAPGGFENYFRELGELLTAHANDPAGQILHELPEFGELAEKYGLTFRTPDWLADVVQRYGLNAPTH